MICLFIYFNVGSRQTLTCRWVPVNSQRNPIYPTKTILLFKIGEDSVGLLRGCWTEYNYALLPCQYDHLVEYCGPLRFLLKKSVIVNCTTRSWWPRLLIDNHALVDFKTGCKAIFRFDIIFIQSQCHILFSPGPVENGADWSTPIPFVQIFLRSHVVWNAISRYWPFSIY